METASTKTIIRLRLGEYCPPHEFLSDFIGYFTSRGINLQTVITQ